MKPIRLMSGFLTVGVWTLLSRVLGFARDVLIAGWLGAGPVAEAFLVAFSLPNMFRRFFAEGAFNTAFIPLFSKKLETEDAPQAFANDAFSALGTLLIAFTLLAQVLMPWLVFAMASGFTGDERFGLAVVFGRIAFPYILFISLAALLSGVLNATGRFAAAAAAPVLLNIILIGALMLAESGLLGGVMEVETGRGASRTGMHHATLLVWGVLLAGVAQLALLWVAASRAGFRIRPHWPRVTPDLKRLAIIALPAMLAGGVVQINLLVGRQVASFYDGAIAWLSYADRLYQLPLGVVGIAVGVVLLPDLSRRLAAGDDSGSRHALSRAGEVSLALTIPSAVALVAIPSQLVSVLFQRGAFGAEDTAATALIVAIYGLGLPAFVMQKVLQPLYFAREDTRTPFRFAVVSMIVNIAVAVSMAWLLGYVGAAIGTTVAAWAMVAQLMRGRRDMGDIARFDDRFRTRLWRICAAAAIMGVTLWLSALVLAPALAMPGWRYLALLVLVIVGIVTYFGAGQAIGAFRLAEFRAAMRRSG
ncbi:murein biosynthesis integral membrane protein MurJ [Sedimentitalea sp. JM2-8]|uniref:Probable lipid II flippase MurJ n=1 Tax=Sedimentitalea xiamensis TaxID=3050037 RepID=A0ABT7FAV7_9RHOB|nr:murein biosynthesis integral membrane protein MurJ [Sedimentitalea xiamensis]MDK3072168.1 murein biosynthesis integral membrane protein MurJ [Sedimentitalea xiamensis]